MKYLLTATLLFLPLSIDLSRSAMARPSKCSTVLARSKSSLAKVTRFKISNFDKYDGIPPKGRTQHLSIIFRGIHQSTELAMATKIIAGCPQIGSVRFVIDGTDDQSVYGLLNGKVRMFKCKDMDSTNKWGEYACS